MNWYLIAAAVVVVVLGVVYWRYQQQQKQVQVLQGLFQGLAPAVAGSGQGVAEGAAGAAAGASAGVAKQRQAVDVTDQELELYLQDARPSVVMFHSPNCGHCRAMMDDYSKYGQVAGEKVHILRVDCSKYSNVADKYKIQGFPTIYLFKNGQTSEYHGDRKVGSLMGFASGN